MKRSGLVAAASVAVASATTAVAASSSFKIQLPRQDACGRVTNENSASNGPSSSEKFAPRFDGLRFIETLVTAHR